MDAQAGPPLMAQYFAPSEAPPVERQVAADMARRGLIAAPAPIIICGAIWGVHGAISAAFAVVLAIGNLLLAAAVMSWAAKVSLVMLAAAALGGYLVRLGILTAILLLVRNQSWVSWIPLALTLLVTHLGLLFWETRYVSATLAYPGLRPAPRQTKGM
jgi:hypothetical protein